jgi:hypothetical protein
MDFRRALTLVSEYLEREGQSYALVGAFALQSYGLARATQDVDFVTEASARVKLVTFLETQGYETLHVSSGYSSHLHPDPAKGRLDFIYVDGETGRKLFAGCEVRAVGTGVRLPVPRPEHLAAMKALAMKNDPGRTFQEMADVRFLLGLPGVDRDEVEGYFRRHGLEERFDEIAARS